nr:MAG TPA: hypothetical protein [Caudoviricetes sp.]
MPERECGKPIKRQGWRMVERPNRWRRAAWARSRDERCVNRVYRASLQIYGPKKYSGED